jgi:hypothetical protein
VFSFRRSGRGAALLELSLVVAGATLVTLLWLSPLVRHLDSAVLSKPSDSTATIRFYWLAEHEHRTPFTLGHDAYVNAPEGSPTQQGAIVANAVQPAFVWSLRGALGLVGAWNLFLIVGFVLTATFAYYLARSLGLGVAAAIFAGYVFTFNTYMFQKAAAGHGGLVQAWILPLVALLLLRRERRPRRGIAVAIGIALALASYLHTYYGLIAGVLVLVAYAVSFARRRPQRRATVGSALLSFAVAAVCLIPAALAQRLDSGGSVSQYSHSLDALQQFGSNPLAFLTPAAGNPLFGGILSAHQRTVLERTGEPTLFFGWITIVLACAGLVLLLRRRVGADDATRTVLLTTALIIPVAYYMSLPRLVHLGPIAIPAGSWFVGHVTTVFRVYARFGVLVGLGLTILAALALDRGARKWRAGSALSVAITALVAVELIYQLPPTIWRTNRLPAHDRLLAGAPRGIVAFYPAPNGDSQKAADLANREMWFQTYTHQKLFFSSQPNSYDRKSAIRAVARELDRPEVPGLLAAEDVRYLALDVPTFRAAGIAIPNLSAHDFQLLGRRDGVVIYRVTADKADVDQVLRADAVDVGANLWGQPVTEYTGPNFYGEEQRFGAIWRWMRQDGTIHVDVPDAPHYILRFHAFSASVARQLTVTDPSGRTLARVTVPPADTPFELGPFTLRRGSYNLTLHTEPGPAPLGPTDPRVASIYLSPVELLPYADFGR